MREILFRGKRTDNGEWVYGSCLPHDGCAYIMPPVRYTGITIIEMFIRVIPETVGQYTGLRDSNGTKIFEGDIVYTHTGEYCCGYWEHSTTVTAQDMMALPIDLFEAEFIEVIGNIHDNPELLKGDK
jgi:uncharacterized phage protein (TIGR01671 family)